jgi:hypothetical protein
MPKARFAVMPAPVDPASSLGLWPAVAEFVSQGVCQIRRRYESGLGITILERAT